MKKLIIFGNADFARLLKYYIDNDDVREVECFTVNSCIINEKEFCGLPVVDFESIQDYYSPDEYEILLAIGNSRMNELRKKIFIESKAKGYNIASYFHSSCSINSREFGEGNIMLENCLIYPFSKIGSGNLLWDHVIINHDCVVGDFNTFAGYADLCGYVRVGNNGYFGKHCVLNERMSVADYTLIGAAAYAKGETKPYEVIVPARSVTLQNKKSTDLM